MNPGTNPALDLNNIGPKSTVLPSFSVGGVLPVVFTLIFIIWAIYSLIVLYHWVRFGRDQWHAVPCVVGYAIGSIFILGFMASSLASV